MFILLEVSRPVARQMERLEDAMRRVDELVVQARPALSQKLGRLAEVEERGAEVLGRELLRRRLGLDFRRRRQAREREH